MRKTILMFVAGAMFLWAAAPYAQVNPNLMGLTSQSLWADWCLYGPGLQVYTVDLYVLDPVNPDFGGGGTRPVAWISGFECRVWIEGDASLLGWHFPVDAINAGTNGNTVVGFSEPVPVVDGMAIVASLDIFLGIPGGQTGGGPKVLKNSPLPCDEATAFAFMAPTRPTSSIAGMMAYLDADDPDDPLVGATSHWEFPDDLALMMQWYPVAAEQQAWGGVKALYR